MSEAAHSDPLEDIAIEAAAIALYNSLTVYYHLSNLGWMSLTATAKEAYYAAARREMQALKPPSKPPLTGFSARLFNFAAARARQLGGGQ